MIFTDRYKVLGIPYPKIETMCKGQCEGTGIVPTQYDSEDKVFCDLWLIVHKKSCSILGRIKKFFNFKFKATFRKCDGWHFVKCPDCNGSGKRRIKF